MYCGCLSDASQATEVRGWKLPEISNLQCCDPSCIRVHGYARPERLDLPVIAGGIAQEIRVWLNRITLAADPIGERYAAVQSSEDSRRGSGDSMWFETGIARPLAIR